MILLYRSCCNRVLGALYSCQSLMTFTYFERQAMFISKLSSALLLLSMLPVVSADQMQVTPELVKLFDQYRGDPLIGRYIFKLENDPGRIAFFQERYNRALYAFTQMDFGADEPFEVKEYCYRFAECLEDPLCHELMKDVKEQPKQLRLYTMARHVVELEQRDILVRFLRDKARKFYRETGVDDATQKKLLDMIWQDRYLFANVMDDPMIDCIVQDLPNRGEIPDKLKEALVRRRLLVKDVMQQWEISPADLTEYVVYCYLDHMRMHQDEPFAGITYLSRYSHDTTRDEYNELYTLEHISKCVQCDITLIEGLTIPDVIGNADHADMRIYYQALLSLSPQYEDQRTLVRNAIKIIFHACDGSVAQRQLAKFVAESMLYDDVDKAVIPYVSELERIMKEGNEEKIQAIVEVLTNMQQLRLSPPQRKAYVRRLSQCINHA